MAIENRADKLIYDTHEKRMRGKNFYSEPFSDAIAEGTPYGIVRGNTIPLSVEGGDLGIPELVTTHSYLFNLKTEDNLILVSGFPDPQNEKFFLSALRAANEMHSGITVRGHLQVYNPTFREPTIFFPEITINQVKYKMKSLADLTDHESLLKHKKLIGMINR